MLGSTALEMISDMVQSRGAVCWPWEGGWGSAGRRWTQRALQM